MTGTSVKDVSSAFVNLPVSQGSKSQTGTREFQKIWNAQMSKGTADGSVGNHTVQDSDYAAPKEDRSSQTSEDTGSRPVQKSGGSETENVQSEEQKVQEAGPEESAGTEASPESTEEQSVEEAEIIPAEGLEEVMEVLNTAAWNLMQQIADTFGISLEEVQAAMEELDMGQLDLLDAAKLGTLLLNLGGAEDSYALITDEGLYEQYQALMTGRADAVSESAQTLEKEPEELTALLKEEAGKVQEEPVDGERFSVRDERPAAEEEKPVLPAERTAGEGVQEEERTGRQPQEQPEREGAHSESREKREEPINLFTQNVREQQFRPELQQTGEVPASQSWSTGTRQIMDQIMDYMKLQLTGDTTNLEMQLHPASLGTLQVQLVSKGGMVTAHFIAQNAVVKEALESQVIQLREQFEEQGVKVEAIEVTVQTHEFERNLEQGRGRDPRETEKRGRGRRVHPGVASGDSEEQKVPEDDLITGGGSTVSFSA